MLGICNGFQALVKLGLVPFGEIVDMEDNSPTLTFNSIGRHQSMMVKTRIASNKSPWLLRHRNRRLSTRSRSPTAKAGSSHRPSW